MATSMTPHVTHLEPNADVALLGRQQGTHDWRTGLPVLLSPRVSLRELMPSDAQSLHDLLATREVQRYMTPGPKTVRDFEQFIRWTHGARESGQYACYGVVPNGHEAAVGIFQLWPVEPGFATAEWGFALGSPLWGTGLFRDCAPARHRFRDRDDGRAAARSSGGRGQRPRERRPAEARGCAGRDPADAASKSTASTVTTRCGRSSPTSGLWRPTMAPKPRAPARRSRRCPRRRGCRRPSRAERRVPHRGWRSPSDAAPGLPPRGHGGLPPDRHATVSEAGRGACGDVVR